MRPRVVLIAVADGSMATGEAAERQAGEMAAAKTTRMPNCILLSFSVLYIYDISECDKKESMAKKKQLFTRMHVLFVFGGTITYFPVGGSLAMATTMRVRGVVIYLFGSLLPSFRLYSIYRHSTYECRPDLSPLPLPARLHWVLPSVLTGGSLYVPMCKNLKPKMKVATTKTTPYHTRATILPHNHATTQLHNHNKRQ